jgi:hypothetical protein
MPPVFLVALLALESSSSSALEARSEASARAAWIRALDCGGFGGLGVGEAKEGKLKGERGGETYIIDHFVFGA